jgi:nucleoside phosphorylase
MHGPDVSLLLEAFARKREYLELRKRWGDLVATEPSVRAGLVVSGSTVVASEESAKEVLKLFPSAVGLDMEIFAVYTAAFKALGHPSEIVAIKTVADLADSEKRDDAQELASELSAEVLKLGRVLIKSGPRREASLHRVTRWSNCLFRGEATGLKMLFVSLSLGSHGQAR